MFSYDKLFGENKDCSEILSMLGLNKGDVGRFRDCYIDGDRIAIVTRNGGGNRECCCVDNPMWGLEWCKHRVIEKDGEKFYYCVHPCSIDCGCTGCVMTYRIPQHPQHPLYLYDEDDDFDCTYATIYFSIPEKFKDIVLKLKQQHCDE